MKPMVLRMASKRGARQMPAEDQLDAARRDLGCAHPELRRAGFLAPARARSRESTDWDSAALVIAQPPEHLAATSRDKMG